MILVTLLTSLLIPAGSHNGQVLYTDMTGHMLRTDREVLSTEPGAGLNPLSTDNALYWKECPEEGNQQIVADYGEVVYSRRFFSGPFPAPPEAEIMVSIPEEILLLDGNGSIIRSLNTGEYPGSLTFGEGFIWFVSSEKGMLIRLDPETGASEQIDLTFTPLTVSYMDGRFLLGRADGGFSLMNSDLQETLRIPEGFMGALMPENELSWCRWVNAEGCEALSWETVTRTENGTESYSPLEPSYSETCRSACGNRSAHFDVPAIYQRWDTPDWFNGSWSCGPTSCLMAVQYYNRLTPDSIWVNYPYGHWSRWGNYIPVEYTFLGYTYDILGKSPGGVWVPGAHGFICRSYGGAGWSYMCQWMEQHSLEANWLGTTWSACTEELNNSWPVVASTSSPYTGGHILLFNGYYSNHSVICNDAYGDQNVPGWGTMMNGKDVVYDWPGYNNGNVQLGVSQLFSARSEPLETSGTIIDDRTMGYEKLGPCQYWHEQTTGYNGYSWWTYSTGALPDTCIVRWNPVLPSAGQYRIETWIPSSHATATGIYHVNTQSGWETVTVNQNSYSNQWAELGIFQLDPSTAQVRMGDYTGTASQFISFDAMKFTAYTGIENSSCSTVSKEFKAATNPIRSGELLIFSSGNATVTIYDHTGRRITETEGILDTTGLPAGVYHAVVHENNGIASSRFTVIP
ncbi:hypothetical protein CSA37_04210 [Candidatus Fermentibacteria bacterium]|nr:MAG: hypothetical protein CSA37_04210 [Candidatus Fermentibacteria bacterium]